MTECDKFARLRLECFGTESPQPPFMMDFDKVVNFLKAAKIETLEIYQTTQDYQRAVALPDSGDEADRADPNSQIRPTQTPNPLIFQVLGLGVQQNPDNVRN